MKKYGYLLSLLLLCNIAANSQTVASYQWAGTFSGSGNEYPESIKCDASGNVVIAGRFDGTADLDPGAGTLLKTSAGINDCFIVKLDPNGNLLWGRAFGGVNTDRINAQTIDAAGNIIVAGYFSGTVDFDPGAGSNSITSTAGTDFFISKFDANGNYQWTKTFGDQATDYSYAITTDQNYNIYVGGEFSSDSVDMDPGVGVAMVYNSVFASFQFEGYVLKLDSAGAFIWCNTMKGTASDYVRSLAVTSSQEIVVGGYFNTGINLDPAGVISSKGSSDFYLAKFDQSGTFTWLKTFGGTGADYVYSCDIRGNHLIGTGTFTLMADFDPSPDTLSLFSNGGTDVYLLDLDAGSGSLNWAVNFGSYPSELSNALATHPDGSIYVTGSFVDSTQLDPTGNATTLISYDQRDGFISKFDSLGNFIFGHRLGSINVDYGRAITVDYNSDKFWTAGYFGNGNFYPDPNSMVNYIPSGGNNDTYIGKYSSCAFPVISSQPVNTGTCPGGNSSFNVVATGSNITYQWQIGLNFGTTWTNLLDTGIYSGTTTAGLQLTGAGSVVNNSFYRCIITADCGLSKTTNVAIMFATAPNINVNQNQHILSAVQSGAVYRWLDCNNGYASIPFATTQQYIPSQPGSYAVEITFNGCTDTSSCYNVTVIGIDEINNDQLHVFPIPAHDQLSVEMKKSGHYIACIYDLSGKRVMNNNEIEFDQYLKIDLSSLEPGTYLLGVKSSDGNESYSRIIRQ